MEIFHRADAGGDGAHRHRRLATLQEHVDAEAGRFGGLVGEVDLHAAAKALAMMLVEQHVEDGGHVLAGDRRPLFEGVQNAVDADRRRYADLQVHVGSTANDCFVKDCV